jgi:hypothetical protein
MKGGYVYNSTYKTYRRSRKNGRGYRRAYKKGYGSAIKLGSQKRWNRFIPHAT